MWLKKLWILVIINLLLISQLNGCIETQNKNNNTKKDEVSCILQKPGFDDYELTYNFNDPLNISENNPGPGGTTNLESCIDYCSESNITCECRDWIQSIYNSFNTNRQKDIRKINGIWLPTIDTVRDAVRKIPTLKKIGINTVSFGPDIETVHSDKPRTIGDNLFRFYIKLFEDAGFNVHLVPNSMHWGNNNVSLYDLNEILLDWAVEAERLNSEFYVTFNEVDGMQENISETSIWLQKMLPEIKERYSGIVCVQPTQAGFRSMLINYSGFDCVSAFYPLMVPDEERVNKELRDFKEKATNIRVKYPSIKYILFNDVATFSGGNWAETYLMEAQIEAEKEGRSEYSTEEQQAQLFEKYLNEMHPFVNGTFFNNCKGFTFIGRAAEQIVEEKYSQYGTLPIYEKDYLWNTTGFLELIENATLDDKEKNLIFDLDKYSGKIAGWAGLCFEPTTENPGPFNCTSVESCMDLFRNSPEKYWRWILENC